MNGDRRGDAPAPIAHGHRDRDQAGHVFLVVDAEVATAQRVQLALQRRAIGDRPGSVTLQRRRPQQRRTPALRHRREEELAARGAVDRHLRPGGEVQAQRPVRLDAIEVDDAPAVEHRQVAGLADARDQSLEDRVALGLCGLADQHVAGESRETRRRPEAARPGLPDDEARVDELPEQPVGGGGRESQLPGDRRRLGRPCRRCDERQRLERARERTRPRVRAGRRNEGRRLSRRQSRSTPGSHSASCGKKSTSMSPITCSTMNCIMPL